MPRKPQNSSRSAKPSRLLQEEAALDIVRADGLTESEAVRTALREAGARRRLRSSLREEVRRLAGDSDDRDEMRIIREQMAELAPPSTD